MWWKCFLAGCSDLLESCHHCDITPKQQRLQEVKDYNLMYKQCMSAYVRVSDRVCEVLTCTESDSDLVILVQSQ